MGRQRAGEKSGGEKEAQREMERENILQTDCETTVRLSDY